MAVRTPRRKREAASGWLHASGAKYFEQVLLAELDVPHLRHEQRPSAPG
ncbi:MAG: hypothetical protein QM756_19965 [Polyangiaceae bacterium]